MIRLNNITKVYEAKEGNVLAIKDISMDINKGEIYGIMGVSGAGKSTLIRCLNLLERPTAGEVWVNNVNLTNLSASKLREERKNIGMIFQHYNLLSSRTVFNNIAYPLELAGVKKQERDNRIDELLDLVDLKDKQNHYPSQLSGGQRQRVAIARALATNPEVLLSDEATSALDPITSRSILDLLQEINLKLGVTIVLITHQMEVIEQICHRVAVIKNGSIVEEGPVSKVFLSPENPYTKLLLGMENYNPNKKDLIDLFKTKKVGAF
jgi:D-methionine transport system ATP-binding protein